MNEQELNEVLQSDIRLWEVADTVQHPDGAVTKTLDLPYGIGVTEVRLEGMTDGIKRKAAFESYGNYIRGLVHEQTDDGAIQARAEAAAARSKQDNRTDSLLVDRGGAPLTADTPSDVPGAEEPYGGHADGNAGLGATLIAQRTALAAKVGRAEANLATWRRELKALDAACKALEEDDAPTDTRTPEQSPALEMEQD